MDELDRRIIHELQADFPLVPRPYAAMADKVGIAEDELCERIRMLIDDGIIRRIGLSIDSRRLGYSSTLAAIRIPHDGIDRASDVLSAFPQITHSYLRDDAFNIWFTVIAHDERRIDQILEQIRTMLGLSMDDMMNLPVKKIFKLDARFKV